MTFRVGQLVRVAARAHEGHHRTPLYVQGKIGRVEGTHGQFANPETRAYGADGLPKQHLYLIGFAQTDLWPGYRGPPGDRLALDLFGHWLEEME
jgi:nitrile hydratase